MMSVTTPRPEVLHWLLDPSEPGPRYLALRDLVRLPPDDPELRTARRAAHVFGPISYILDQMDPAGFWVKPGPGYNPKYTSTVWALILLAQLGGSVAEDERIARACAYYLDHALAPGGQIASSTAPGGTVDCLQGNMCWALAALGCRDPRLAKAFDWLARSVTGEGIAPLEDKRAAVRYYAYKRGPDFECGVNNNQACAWGGAKVMLALGVAPDEYRSSLWQSAVDRGAAFFLGTDPATAGYPNGWADKPNRAWWQFGFPVFYVTDILQIVEGLAALGYRDDPRLANALTLVRSKADAEGRWPIEYAYHDKTWVDFGRKGQPSKWVTIRALRSLAV